MEKLLQYLTREITGSKDIKVEKIPSGDFTVYTIKAPKDVIGLLIGKNGRTIKAIRVLARVRAIVDNEKISVRLEEPEA